MFNIYFDITRGYITSLCLYIVIVLPCEVHMSSPAASARGAGVVTEVGSKVGVFAGCFTEMKIDEW